MYEVTPEDKILAELRSRHDRLWKLEKRLNSIINNPNVTKRDEEKYISRIEASKREEKTVQEGAFRHWSFHIDISNAHRLHQIISILQTNRQWAFA
jgi:hypothetical protein